MLSTIHLNTIPLPPLPTSPPPSPPPPPPPSPSPPPTPPPPPSPPPHHHHYHHQHHHHYLHRHHTTTTTSPIATTPPPLPPSPLHSGICSQSPYHFIVMEYCVNGQLYEVLRARDISARQSYDWALQLAQGDIV